MLDLSDIHLEGQCTFSLKGKFAFCVEWDDSITLFLSERKRFFLEGIIHELTEASVIQSLEYLRLNYRYLYNFEVQVTEFLHCRIWHLVTVMSMPLYSHNKKYQKEFESLFKGEPKNDLRTS